MRPTCPSQFTRRPWIFGAKSFCFIMSSEKRIVREYTLFNNQVCFKVYFDENLVLSIVVDLDSLQFSTPQFDCDLEVLSKESTILVKLCSLFKNDLEDLGDC